MTVPWLSLIVLSPLVAAVVLLFVPTVFGQFVTPIIAANATGISTS